MLELDLRKHWRIILIISLSAAVLAIIISIIAGLISKSAGGNVEPQEDALNSLPQVIVDELEVYPEKLMLPPIPDEFWYGRYRPFEEQKRQWDLGDLSRFYYDPRDIGADNLRDLNSQQIEQALDNIR